MSGHAHRQVCLKLFARAHLGAQVTERATAPTGRSLKDFLKVSQRLNLPRVSTRSTPANSASLRVEGRLDSTLLTARRQRT
eukprot:5160994-Prymnesium_polylepis.1